MKFGCAWMISGTFANVLEFGRIKDTRHKMVALLPGIAHPKRSNNHHQELKHLETRDIEAEGNHVLVSFDRMRLWKPPNVVGVMEKSLTLRRHETGIVLTETLQTSSLRVFEGVTAPPPRGIVR